MLPSPNQQIRIAAWHAATGRIPELPTDPGWCLMFVRLVVEQALQLPAGGMYDRWLVAGSSYRPGSPEERLAAAKRSKMATDMEASAKRLGWGVPFHTRLPGDIVFNYRAAPPFGHVAVLLDRDTVLENIDPRYRPDSVHLPSNLSISPLESVPWTLTARIIPPDTEGEGGGPISG